MRLEVVLLAVLTLGAHGLAAAQQRPPVTIGSKTFTESYVLGEVMAQLLESRGFPVQRRFGFGGTLICYEALRVGEIDVYPEYSGTIEQVILKAPGTNGLVQPLAALGLEPLGELGFDNTYALAVTAATADRLGLRTISDLRTQAQLRIGLSHEFRDRADGWPGLKAAYALPQGSIGIEHGLAYQALLEGEIDVTDAYSTDADVDRYGLVVLDDDLGFFPSYLALPLARTSLPAEAKATLNLLEGRFDDATMRALNARVVVEGRTFAQVASEFLLSEGLIGPEWGARSGELWPTLARNTWVHLKLTGIAILAACVVGLALSLAVYRSRTLSTAILYVAGLMQTVPSIALLALLIPLAGVGQVPAIIALFLYSLLPITRNTVTALLTIDPLLRRVSSALGLTHFEQLRHVYVPLALPHLLAGLRIAAVVSIGTATLAAFIGAGGLGEPIVTGLALNDTSLILQGAIPAALLALAAELLFEGLERALVPRHLLARY